MKKFSEFITEGAFTGEPYIKDSDMASAYSRMYSNWAKKFKKINSKFKGTGEFEIIDIPGTTSKVPELVLYYSRNKKNSITLSQEPRYGKPYLNMNIGLNFAVVQVDLEDYEFSTIENGLKKLAQDALPKMETYKDKFGPYNYPKAFKNIVEI